MRKYREERRLEMQKSKMNLLIESKRERNRLLLQREIEQNSDPLESGEASQSHQDCQEIAPADDELKLFKEETL